MESWDSVILYSLCVRMWMCISEAHVCLIKLNIPFTFSDSNVKEMILSSLSLKTFLKSTGNTTRHVYLKMLPKKEQIAFTRNF